MSNRLPRSPRQHLVAPTRRLTALIMACSLTCSLPVHAQSPHGGAIPKADQPPDRRDPWVSVGLSAIPLALSVPTMVAGLRGISPIATGTTCEPAPNGPACAVDITYPAFSMPFQTAVGISVVLPLGLAGGYVHAGDPLRGALVGAGGVAVPVLAGLLGFGLDNGLGMSARLGYEKPTGVAPLMMTTAIVSTVAYVGYQAWALWDVYQTTEALNRERDSRPSR